MGPGFKLRTALLVWTWDIWVLICMFTSSSAFLKFEIKWVVIITDLRNAWLKDSRRGERGNRFQKIQPWGFFGSDFWKWQKHPRGGKGREIWIERGGGGETEMDLNPVFSIFSQKIEAYKLYIWRPETSSFIRIHLNACPSTWTDLLHNLGWRKIRLTKMCQAGRHFSLLRWLIWLFEGMGGVYALIGSGPESRIYQSE